MWVEHDADNVSYKTFANDFYFSYVFYVFNVFLFVCQLYYIYSIT